MTETSHVKAEYVAARLARGERVVRLARILRVLTRTDFKLKYAGSVLGYVWSVAKPLLYFAVLWVVFENIFRTTIEHFQLYLIVGVVIWTFVADAVTATLPSIVARGSLLRRIFFPPIVIPVAATLTALLSFGLNLLVVVVFFAFAEVGPGLGGLVLPLLFIELYLFVLGLSVLAATLYVRFRDVGQIWEVGATMLFFSAPIVYPVAVLPGWAENAVAFNPMVQVIQDARRVVLGADANAPFLLGSYADRLVPLGVTVLLLAVGFWLYDQESPRFAEVA